MSVLLGKTVIEAVHSFYLAKRTRQYFRDLPENDDRVGRGLDAISERLMRIAVVDIAGINDGGLRDADPGYSRTASLPTAHQRIKRYLMAASSSPAGLNQLEDLKRAINVDRYAPLKYVRHVRNKWAGHPSLDRRFDAWAGADKTLSIAAVEAALVRLVNNAQNTAAFVSSIPILRDFDQPAAVASPDGHEPTEINLGNVLLWAELTRESVDRNVHALRAQITGVSKMERQRNTDASPSERY